MNELFACKKIAHHLRNRRDNFSPGFQHNHGDCHEKIISLLACLLFGFAAVAKQTDKCRSPRKPPRSPSAKSLRWKTPAGCSRARFTLDIDAETDARRKLRHCSKKTLTGDPAGKTSRPVENCARRQPLSAHRGASGGISNSNWRSSPKSSAPSRGTRFLSTGPVATISSITAQTAGWCPESRFNQRHVASTPPKPTASRA